MESSLQISRRAHAIFTAIKLTDPNITLTEFADKAVAKLKELGIDEDLLHISEDSAMIIIKSFKS